MLASVVQPEIQSEDLCVTGWECPKRAIDLLDKQLIHDLHIRIALLIGHESVTE
jgi:hypothetical protein